MSFLGNTSDAMLTWKIGSSNLAGQSGCWTYIYFSVDWYGYKHPKRLVVGLSQVQSRRDYLGRLLYAEYLSKQRTVYLPKFCIC